LQLLFFSHVHMKQIIPLLICIFTLTGSMKAQEIDNQKISIIYVGDPMCSWCYGFSPEFSEALQDLGESIELQVVMGGLRPFNKETMTDLKAFLKGHWEEVHERSKQEFSYGILDNADMVYDTEPACRAVVTMKQFDTEILFDFFKDVQIAFYAQNLDPLSTETYAVLAQKYGVNKEAFAKKFESQEMKDAVKKDFALAQQLNARSFPTVIAKKGETYYLVARGYMEASDVIANVKKVMAQ